MFFVSDVSNNGQNVLDIVITKPNRERQKLMREQNILKQVIATRVKEAAEEDWRWGLESSAVKLRVLQVTRCTHCILSSFLGLLHQHKSTQTCTSNICDTSPS